MTSDLQKLIKTIQSYLPQCNIKKIEEAFEFAKEAHKDQKRSSGEPYITHPLAAAQILANSLADEETIIACLLHDVPEDTEKTLQDIEKLFGPTIKTLVDGVTKFSKMQYQNNMQEAQVESLKKMLLIMTKDKRVILIKIADRLHNMQTLGFVRPEKQERIARETLEVYVPLSRLIGAWKIQTQLEDLCSKQLYPEAYQEITQRLYPNEKTHEKNENIISKKILQCTEKMDIPCQFIPVKKSILGIYQKFTRDNIPFENVHETYTFFVVTDSIPHCYNLLGIIHSQWKPQIGKFRDYISVPKNNHYQSIHTKVFSEFGVLEFLIRTEEMNQKAEYGISTGAVESKETWLDEILATIHSGTISEKFMQTLRLDTLEKSIFVFTPIGDVIKLKKGSTPLDFAYAVHSELGNTFEQALVNDKPVTMDFRLTTGSVVNVKTNKKNRPSSAWLQIAQTNLAKKYIRKYLNHFPIIEKIKRGKTLLSQKIELIGEPYISKKQWYKILEAFHKKNPLEIYKCLGEGSIDVDDILEALYEKQYLPNHSFIYKIFTLGRKSAAGEKIFLRIISHNRNGLLADIGNVARSSDINILGFKTQNKRCNMALLKIRIRISNFQQLKNFLENIPKIKGVVKIQKTTEQRSIAIQTLFFANLFYWISQPFILYFMDLSHWKYLPLYFILGGMLSIGVTYFFQNVSKHLITEITKVHRLWITCMTMNIFISLLLVAEKIYLDLPFHWIFILSFIIIIAGTSFTEYYQYRYGE